jgi:hypothetical protein
MNQKQSNEVMRFGREEDSLATEVVLLGKLGGNEVCISFYTTNEFEWDISS